MSRIVTVLGEIAPESLGYCQSHEHVCIVKGYPASVHPAQCIDDRDKSTEELEIFRRAGGNTIVDAQPIGAGRDANFLAEVSKRSGVHVISSTGFHKMMFYPEDHWVYRFDEDTLAALYISELREGMFVGADSGEPIERTIHKAGQLKVAMDVCGLTPQYEKLFSAAAQAAAETGAPLMIHVDIGSDALMMFDFLTKRSVKPAQMIFCHMDRATPDLAHHMELMKQGAYLEYDTIARDKYHDDTREIEILRYMLDADLGDQILMSLDVTRERLTSYGGEPGLDYILREFIPKAEASGIGTEQMKRIFHENPARAFAY